jgi:hypothetical protein
MAESLSDFPFHKLGNNKYLAIEVMMYIDYQEVCKFMFAVNKETRSFIEQYFIAIRNGFTNEGLIT